MTDAALEVAERLTKAFDNLDAEFFESAYSQDAVVWHSFDRLETDRATALKGVRRFFRGLSALACSEVRRMRTDEGFLQQHLLSGTFAAGGGFKDLPVCLIVRVAGDKIARIDEYIDPKFLAPRPD